MVTGSLFATLWLTVLVPFAFGGPEPTPQGPGGAPYPVFVLDLVVALPCIVAVGMLLVRGRVVGTPLAVVALVKIVTLFTALWAGVAVQAMTDVPVHLAADAGPSALLLAVSALADASVARPHPCRRRTVPAGHAVELTATCALGRDNIENEELR